MKHILLLIFILSTSANLFSQAGKTGNEQKKSSKLVKPGKNDAKENTGPATPFEYVTRGNERLELNDLAGALEDFNKALETDAEYYRAYLSRGKVKFVQQDFENAMVDFNKTIEITEKLIDEADKRGKVKIILGDHKGAAREYNAVSTLQPVLAEAIFNRGNVKFFLNNNDGCCEDLNKAAGLGYLKAYEYIRKYCQGGVLKDTVIKGQ